MVHKVVGVSRWLIFFAHKHLIKVLHFPGLLTDSLFVSEWKNVFFLGAKNKEVLKSKREQKCCLWPSEHNVMFHILLEEDKDGEKRRSALLIKCFDSTCQTLKLVKK